MQRKLALSWFVLLFLTVCCGAEPVTPGSGSFTFVDPTGNPGWYTMPVHEIQYPYGLGDTEVDADQLGKVFARRFVLLLGTVDTDPEHESLRKTPEAMAQGPHRLARGKQFVKKCRLLAKQLDLKMNWTLIMVPNVGHSNSKMSFAAAKLIR